MKIKMTEQQAHALRNHLKDVASLHGVQDFCFVSIVEIEDNKQEAQVIKVGQNEIVDFVNIAVCDFINYIS